MAAKFVILCLFSFCLLLAHGRSVGEKFDGYFKYINTTVFMNGQWVPWNSANPAGSINWKATKYGGLTGNMSVVFGQQAPVNSTPAVILQNTAAYAGRYEIDTTLGRICHIPEISTSTSVPPGVPNCRFYQWYDYDNLLNLAVPGYADLWWRRVNEFPRLNADVSIVASGNPWIENGANKQTYRLTITNRGPGVITAMNIVVNGGTVYSEWGLNRIGNTNEFSVDLYNGLAVNGRVQPGFIATAGSGIYVTISGGQLAD